MSLWYISIISPFILLNYVEIRNPYVSSGPVFSPYAFAGERRGIPRARGRTGPAPLLRHQTDGSRLGERLPMWLGIDMDPFKAQHVLQPLKKKHIRTIKKNCHHILTTTKWGIAGSCLIKGWHMFINREGPTQSSTARLFGMWVLVNSGMIINMNLTLFEVWQGVSISSTFSKVFGSVGWIRISTHLFDFICRFT